MSEHKLIPPAMEPGTHIKHIDTATGEEYWATVSDNPFAGLHCPYCGSEVKNG